MGAKSLSEYRSRRDFSRTREPRGDRSARRRAEPRFVVQKHGARSLHYDFRLEIGGVLKSWAVPKGPSTNPKHKRLAMPTEDHPLEYGDFEGVIPAGEYGAGPVIVWDAGTYRSMSEATLEDDFDRGHLSIRLEGQKLRGGYVLQRIAKGKRERWLLIKADDDEADARRNPVNSEPESVLSGRTLETLEEDARPRSFEISNRDKVLFPADGITKGDLVEYYERVADTMLPHVRGRIVTMRRFPNGIDGKSFYQKQVPGYFPDWIETVEVEKHGGRLRELVIESAETLAYLANQACIAVHVWPSRADDPNRPDRLILDLDPSVGDFTPVRDAARAVRSVLEDVGLTPFVMTTGSRGLHVVAPLDGRADFDAAKEFALLVARLVAARDPERFTIEQRKLKRGDRLFVDYLRNAYAQHGIAPYSVRAKPGAPVATPLSWHELGRADLNARKYTIRNLFRRLARKPDPWRDIDRHAGSLRQARRKLDALLREER